MSNLDYAVCATTHAIDKHLDQLDNIEEANTYVYDKMVSLFVDQLETAECIEDIEDDLTFEVDYLIERDSLGADREDVLKAIYSDYNLEGCK